MVAAPTSLVDELLDAAMFLTDMAASFGSCWRW